MATKKTSASTKKTTKSKAKAKPEAAPEFEPQAHPDAKLSKKQVQQLYQKLLSERARVMQGLGEHLSDAISNVDPLSDEMDVAQRHTEQAYLMRFADKERKLLVQIQNALEKLEEGEYGVCEGTGEPIALKRLELRPWTRYSVEYKEQVERERKQHHR
jgi:DnaK suppressor protein